MKALLYLCLAALLSGCLPIGIRGQNLPFAGGPATPVYAAPNSAGVS